MALKIVKDQLLNNVTRYRRTKANIKYIVIHYVGNISDGKENVEYYKNNYVGASADFWIGYDGTVWQGNDFYSYYSWHCGGGLQGMGGHRFYGLCNNQNSIGIELCVKKKSTKTKNATDQDWYFEMATIVSAALLVRQLMQELDIDIHHVIRHYDVTGKICPNPWVYDTGSIKWETFRRMITGQEAVPELKQEPTGPNGIPKSKKSFIKDISQICIDLWPDLQILPSVVIAQCCLETGYGLGSDAVELVKRNNLLGMKTDLINSTWKTFSVWQGESFVKRTPEVINGKTTYINDSFRVYTDYRNCIEDYMQFLRNVRNNNGYKYRAVIGDTDPERVITTISQGGYATDPAYIKKVMAIIKENDLTQYDPVKTKSVPEKAVEWALATAADNSHGYDNTKGARTGYPDYACSSYVAAAYRAAGLTSIPANAYTASMWKQFLAAGFEDVTDKVNLKTGKGMLPGDVVLNPGKHVEMVANKKLQLVGARGEATGGAANGKVGDQGGEIAVTNWFDFGWRFCLRYPTEKKKETVTYIVQAGLYKVKANADKALQRVKSVVPDAFIKQIGAQYRVQAGAYSVRANAEKRVAQLKKAGISAIIKTE